ncbi:hypothetical protein H0H87_008337 [Tephrocybe sp. NHM501043]|nr:hypothetical protein H0H87_008337 [Tephrocybe sp. NHM501043]
MISGVLPTGPGTLLTPTGQTHGRAISALTNAIQTITLLNNAVPFEIGKGVLAALAGILGIVMELAERCQMIALVVWRATAGTPEAKLGTAVRRALLDLKKCVYLLRQEPLS